MLPRMIHPDGISKWRTVDFGGIVHTLASGNGDIYDDENIVSDEYPVLVTRPSEHKISTAFAGKYGCLQIGPGEGDTIQLGDTILYKGVTVSGSFSEMQTMTPFNRFALIMPAKKWIRTDVIAIVSDWPSTGLSYGDVYCVGTACKYWDGGAWQDLGPITGDIESSVTEDVTITDGTHAGVAAEANTINGTGIDQYFEVGDAVTLSGAAFPTERTLIVREKETNKLVFYEHSFDAELTTTPTSATIKRTMPDLGMICVNENRVWGYHGKTIYASKLGDFKNWNVFDGIASDSYAVDVLSEGEFTGCVSFMGYPVFFKETGIWKVYGNRPSNFEVMGSAATGCVNGRTLAIANETLFYLSRAGIMSYKGGYPSPVSDTLGDIITGSHNAAAISDGFKYLFWYDGADEYLELDARRGMWHRQKIAEPISYGARYNSRAGLILYVPAKTEGGVTTPAHWDLWAVQTGGTTETIEYFVEFADFTEDVSKAPQYGANEKGTGKVQLRMALAANSTATVKIRFDSMGEWETVRVFNTQETKRSFYLPIIPRRSDHFRIRIEGEGRFELWSLSRESYKGSALRGGSL